VSGVPVRVCARCGHGVFPERSLCPRCGAGEWALREIARGRVEEETTVLRAPVPLDGPVRLALVRLADGPLVIARLERDAARGDEVEVTYQDGVPIVRI
jgi:uncharacterized OB-fold protein